MAATRQRPTGHHVFSRQDQDHHSKPATDKTPRNSHSVSQGSLGLHRDTPHRFRLPRGSRGAEVRRGPGRVAEGREGRGKAEEGRGHYVDRPSPTPRRGPATAPPSQPSGPLPLLCRPTARASAAAGAVAKHSPSKSRRTGGHSGNRGAAQRPPSGRVPPRSARRRIESSRRPAPLPTLSSPPPFAGFRARERMLVRGFRLCAGAVPLPRRLAI